MDVSARQLPNRQSQYANAQQGLRLVVWRQLLCLRKRYANALIHGIFKPILNDDVNKFIHENKRTAIAALVALNFSSED